MSDPTPPTPPQDPKASGSQPEESYDPRTSADAQGTGPRSAADFGRNDRPSPELGTPGTSRPEGTPADLTGSANQRPRQRPGGAAADQVNKGIDAAANADSRTKALNDARKDIAAGTPKDEAAVKAGAVAAANTGVDAVTGGAGTVIRGSGKVGAKAGEVFDKAVSKGATLGYQQWKKGVAALVILAILAGVAIITGSMGFVPAPDNPEDACIADIYDPNLPQDSRLNQSQKQVLGQIYESAIDHNMGANTAALAIYVAYFEHGLQVGSPSEDKGGRGHAGPFQQSRDWYASDMAKSADPAAYEATFGTPNDPRFDVKKASYFFMRAFKTVLTNGSSIGESQEDLVWALDKLGVDTTNPSRLWQAWKAADVSQTLADPANSDAALVLAHSVQNFTPAGVSMRVDSSTDDAKNARNKFPRAIAYFKPILDRSAVQRDEANRIVGEAASAGAAAYYAGVTAPANSDGTLTGRGAFVLGDSLTKGVENELQDAGYTVNAEVGRPASVEQWDILQQTTAAQGAQTWIIELGTNNDGNNTGAVAGWVNGVANARNRAVPQKVYWVAPYRPEDYTARAKAMNAEAGKTLLNPSLGSSDKLVAELKAQATRVNDAAVAAGQQPWLFILDWPDMVKTLNGDPAWFDKAGVHPTTTAGQDQFLGLMLAGSPGNLSSDDIAAESCIGGSTSGLALTISDPRILGKKVVLAYPTKGAFKDAPYDEKDKPWIEKVLVRAESALVDPPCDLDNGPGCPSYCAQLAARLHGQAHSGKDTAYALYQERKASKAIHDGTDKFTIPPGAMLFWSKGVGSAGHVATYVGNGMLVSNYRIKDGGPSWVYQMPAQKMYVEYDPKNYLGWAMPADSWTNSNRVFSAGGSSDKLA